MANQPVDDYRLDDRVAVVTGGLGGAVAYVNGQEIVIDGGFLRTSLMRIQPKADQPTS